MNEPARVGYTVLVSTKILFVVMFRSYRALSSTDPDAISLELGYLQYFGEL